MMVLVLLSSCALFAPSPREIEADRAARRARSQNPPGDCWMRDRLASGLDPTACVPGPWLVTEGEDEAWWSSVDGWRDKDWDPDELLVLGVATSGVGGYTGVIVGAQMQERALRDGPAPALVRRMSVHHRTCDVLWDQVLPDAMLHEYGMLVRDRGWRERRAWAQIREALDRDPTPTPAEWEAMAPEDGTAAAIMWANLDVFEEQLRAADEAWAMALQDACREAPSAAAPCGP